MRRFFNRLSLSLLVAVLLSVICIIVVHFRHVDWSITAQLGAIVCIIGCPLSWQPYRFILDEFILAVVFAVLRFATSFYTAIALLSTLSFAIGLPLQPPRLLVIIDWIGVIITAIVIIGFCFRQFLADTADAWRSM